MVLCSHINLFSFDIYFISLSKLKRNLTTSSISDRMKIEKGTTDKRLVQRYMYTFLKSNRFLGRGGYFFVWSMYAIKIDTTIPSIISTMESSSKSVIKFALLSQISHKGFLCNQRVQSLCWRTNRLPFSSSAHNHFTRVVLFWQDIAFFILQSLYSKVTVQRYV